MGSLNYFSHPHHVALMDRSHTFQSLRHRSDDPHNRHESGHSHKGLLAPHFDVFGTETAYFLNGEIPGVADKTQISIAWLASETLVVRGWMKPIDNEAEWSAGPLADSTLPVAQEKSSSEEPVMIGRPLAGPGDTQQTNGRDTNGRDTNGHDTNGRDTSGHDTNGGDKASNDNDVKKELKCWLHERTTGEFERSFTFPTEVNSDGVRARLENGILKMMVPKIAETVGDTKWIPID